MEQIEMRTLLIFIVIASCNAELYQIKTADLPRTDDNRIISGSPTTIEQYPFAVQVIYKRQYRCGGSLVTTRHVLSAAHCFINKKRGRVVKPISCSIRAGTTISNAGGSRHLVKAIKLHELYDYKTKNHRNDVAVVLMATPVDLTTSVAQLAFLPYQDAVVPDNSLVTAIGWGWTDVGKPSVSTVLNEVTLRKINLKTCQARYLSRQNKTGKILSTITSSMICAGILDVKPGKGSCRSDSGGPLLYKGVVVGVTSWGAACASPKFPGVYVRVANYTNWINISINDSELQIQAHNGTGKGTNPGSTGSLSSRVGAITLLTFLLYLILNV